MRQKHWGWIKLFHWPLTTAHWASGFIFQTSDGPSRKGDKRSLPAQSSDPTCKVRVHSQNTFAWAPRLAGDRMPIRKGLSRHFPGSSVAGILCSQCRGPGSTPDQETRSHIRQQRVQMPQIKEPACCNWDQRSHMPQQRPRAAKENRYLKASKWKQNKKTPKEKRLGKGKIYSQNLVSAMRTFPCKS